ncbi:MAG: hypothetical protein ACFB8W_03710 [Elainellaceae cyanobacterium]
MGPMTDHTSHQALSSYFSLHRRYCRSVNLERDLDKPGAVAGYIPTERSADALRRIFAAIAHPQSHRAWTMTGVYGTGKSAFVHYLLALCAPEKSQMRQAAVAIAHQAFPADSPELGAITASLPRRGLVRAATAGRREPLRYTIARALINGADSFWYGKKKADHIFRPLTDWRVELEEGKPTITDQEVLTLIKDLVSEAKTHLFLAIDELGKNLEFASHHQGVNDLYLLQQIAELTLKGEHQVYLLGILHQSFTGYSERLSAVEQSEWNKVQGRFEDILFVESPNQMVRLIGQAIDPSQADPILPAVQRGAGVWFDVLKETLNEYEISPQILENTYPLHPIAALVLPQLCVRYAQNDRSLFTFLTSDEPYALPQFLNTTTVQKQAIPTLQVHQIYDYFVESVGGLASRTNLQRWVEIQSLIQDARDQSSEVLRVLKTIGVLNLVTSAGNLRATPQLVALALCDRPNDPSEIKHWQKVIGHLQKRGLITHRRQLDELKIWEGSDFDVEAAIRAVLEKEKVPLAETLLAVHPLKPVVAQRHYTTTGNLRYFEQRYGDSRTNLKNLSCAASRFDGLVLYWLDTQGPEKQPEGDADRLPSETWDGKPLIIVRTAQLELLRSRAEELRSLQTIHKSAPELTNDGIAKKEVRHRLLEAERLLDETLVQAFDPANGNCQYWVGGQRRTIRSARAFQATLSEICDRTYPQGLILDNELINRHDLTSQGAKARRELIEAMLECSHQERLGLEGYGPEVTMYDSVLKASGIHRQWEGEWGFYPPVSPAVSPGGQAAPAPQTVLHSVWQAMEFFCLEAKHQQRSLDGLYQQLERPPFGVRQGVIPVLLAALLLHHVDDVGIYKDGTFIPVLGPEHFELLVKDPSRFSVKYFEMIGLRSQVFRELESILRSPQAKPSTGLRNASLLMVAKPLFSFVQKLPRYTLNTQQLSPEARQVLAVLQQAQEPDELLFVSLPAACGFEPITAEREDKTTAKAFRKRLVQCLHEIQTAYDALLSFCHTRLYEAFGVRREVNLREDLQVQAAPLVGQCIEPVLKRFILAAVDDRAADQAWLEALVMIVADKPPKSWSDDDRTRFELALSDLVRRFKNLEALLKDVEARGVGFTAKRLTLTEQDGTEVNQVIWVDADKEDVLERAVEKALALPELQGDSKLHQGFVAKLSERIFGNPQASDFTQPRPTRKQA